MEKPTFQTWEEFEANFKPVFNHIEAKANPSPNPESCCCVNGRMFETNCDQEDFIREQDPNKVWTVILVDEVDENGEDLPWYICKGFHHVNRNGYILTENSWDENTPDVEY
jgi:hypothetical protein